MPKSSFKDYYKILQVDIGASAELIDYVFHLLVRKYHPDNPETGDRDVFEPIIEAHNVLRDPAARARYDILYNAFVDKIAQRQLQVVESFDVDEDIDIQKRILDLLYYRCRSDVGRPGVGDLEIEQYIDCSLNVLEFNLWYMKEKGWICTNLTGHLTVTVEGIDRFRLQCTASKARKFVEHSMT